MIQNYANAQNTLFSLYHLQSMHFVNSFSPLMEREYDSALKFGYLMAAASCTDHCIPGGRRRGFAPVLRWGMRLEQPLPAQCPLCPEISPLTPLVHTPLGDPLSSLTNLSDQDNKNSPNFFHFWEERVVPFLLPLCVEPAQELLDKHWSG